MRWRNDVLTEYHVISAKPPQADHRLNHADHLAIGSGDQMCPRSSCRLAFEHAVPATILVMRIIDRDAQLEIVNTNDIAVVKMHQCDWLVVTTSHRVAAQVAQIDSTVGSDNSCLAIGDLLIAQADVIAFVRTNQRYGADELERTLRGGIRAQNGDLDLRYCSGLCRRFRCNVVIHPTSDDGSKGNSAHRQSPLVSQYK